MTVRSRTSAVVLAGGRSSRFGADKLAADLRGEPLLHHCLRAVAGLCDEVVVVSAPTGLAVPLPTDLPAALVLIADADAFEGPLAALVRGAGRSTGERILLVGGDMPFLQPALLRRLLGWRHGRDGAALMGHDRPVPLPIGLDRVTAMQRASELVDSGVRRLGDLIAGLDLEIVTETRWRALDPDALSLRDIDRPSDLADARTGQSSPQNAPPRPTPRK